MSESAFLIELSDGLDIRTAFRQATQRLVAKNSLSPQEAREWMLHEARARGSNLEEVAKAVITGTKVKNRAGQSPRFALPPVVILSDRGLMDLGLGALTTGRSKAAVPFAGKYRLIDFALSNCVNSGIETVGVITQYEPRTLNAHLAYGRPWGLDRCRGRGGFTLLHPYQKRSDGKGSPGIDWYAGTAHAIYENQDFIFRNRADQTLVLFGSEVYAMDLGVLIAQHRKQEADLTIAVATVETSIASRYHTLAVDREGQVRDLLPSGSGAPSPLAVMGVLLFSTGVLSRRLSEDARRADSTHDLISDLIPRMVRDGDRVMAFQHAGYWNEVRTVYDYWQASLDLLDESVKVHDPVWPIHTQTEVRAPTRIATTAKVTDSLVCEGCIVDGKVEHSVLSPGVYVAPEAVVRNAVVMHNTRVERAARVENAVVDRDVVIGPRARVGSAHSDDLTPSPLEHNLITVVPRETLVLALTTAGVAVSSESLYPSLGERRMG